MTETLYALLILLSLLILATLFLVARLSTPSPVNDDEAPVNDDEAPTMNTRTSKD